MAALTQASADATMRLAQEAAKHAAVAAEAAARAQAQARTFVELEAQLVPSGPPVPVFGCFIVNRPDLAEKVRPAEAR